MILVNFGPLFGEHKLSTAHMSDTFCHRVTKFDMIRGLANWQLIPEFRSGVPRYYATTCISYSLLRLFHFAWYVNFTLWGCNMGYMATFQVTF